MPPRSVPSSTLPAKPSCRPAIYMVGCGSRPRFHSAPPIWRRCSPSWRKDIHCSMCTRLTAIVLSTLSAEGSTQLCVLDIGPIRGKYVASPSYIKEHGAPETPDELLNHEALMQGTETWRFVDGDKIISVNPRGRFKADNGTALAAAAVAGLGVAALPDFLTDQYVTSGALVPVMTRFPLPEAGIFVVRPPGTHPARKVRVLTELLI